MNAMAVKNVFFDLDGTLIESSYDIIRILTDALAKNGLKPQNPIEIGPPLEEMVKNAIPGIEETTINKVVSDYRADYGTDLLERTVPYLGIIDLLKYLKKEGVNVFIATYKPKHMSLKVLDRHFDGLYKDIITPTEIENFEQGKTKTDIFNLLISKWGLKAGESLMIGDSRSDIDCAKETGLYTIAVLYGFGKPEEFNNADAKAATVGELLSKIKSFI